MSSSLNSRTHKARTPAVPSPVSRGRRKLLLACVFGSLAAMAPVSVIATADPLAGLRRWGRGEFRYFGFLVYEATLWAADDPQRPPLALRLDYRRSIAGADISAASVKEMRKLGADEAMLVRWGEQMASLFPDVKPGDHLLGVYRTGGVSFSHNGSVLGKIEDAEFARRFFAIWLDPRSSAPDLRAALLGLPAR